MVVLWKLVISLPADGNHFSCDTLVYDTLMPKELVEVGLMGMLCM